MIIKNFLEILGRQDIDRQGNDRRSDNRRSDDRRQVVQRNAERLPLEIKGTAVLNTGGQAHQREITTKDISAYGVYFLTDLRLNSSDTVVVHLPMEEDEDPFEATGTVVRVEEISENSFGIAVKFETTPNFA
jgi:hypothetical protein